MLQIRDYLNVFVVKSCNEVTVVCMKLSLFNLVLSIDVACSLTCGSQKLNVN